MHCLNDLLNNVQDLENSISIISDLLYVETKDIVDYLKPLRNTFSVLDLNIQSFNAKFYQISVLLDDLAEHNLEPSTICRQETWLDSNLSTASLFNLDNYVSIPLGATYSSEVEFLYTYTRIFSTQ